MSRVLNKKLRKKITTAAEAAKLIKPGTNVGMSGFTGAGYPKEVPAALASEIKAAHDRREEFQIGLFTGASTAPELDGVLAEVDGVGFRTPYQSDPIMRRKINEGISEYADIHLSHLAPMIWAGSMGQVAHRGGRGDLGQGGRPAGSLVVGGQQQDLPRAGRPGHPRGELVAVGRTRGHARHLLRRPAATGAATGDAHPHR